MRQTTRTKRAHGQIRQSQLLTTFGPGSMMDLPNYSVLMGGLDGWITKGDEIVEARLTEKLCGLLEVHSLKLYLPPPDQEDPNGPVTGVTVWQFPEWFITQEIRSNTQTSGRSRRLVHRKQLTRGRYIDDDKQKHLVVPVRFVRACRAGHIGDIDWYTYIHRGKTECRQNLWMEERGTSGDLSEIYVQCECGAERRMQDTVTVKDKALGLCDGIQPWLGPAVKEQCHEPNRLLIRTASNAYFPQIMSVISLPDRNQELREAVEQVWDFISEVNDIDELQYERKKARVNTALDGFTNEEVYTEIQDRRGVLGGEPKSIKLAELETLVSCKDDIGEDKPDGNFYARSYPRDKWDKTWMQSINKVVLVHRLREVVALAGFTRFEAQAPNIEGELEAGVRRAPLAREIKWLPAIENKGEGVFLHFSSNAIRSWLSDPNVINRGQELFRGFHCWEMEHPNIHAVFPGLAYIMLHSFSHLLITAVSLECGYPASSIRERIYALPDVGYGVLLYTGTSDAEGTLGGLIQVGRHIHEHIAAALEMGELCSNDPVCSQHAPENTHEYRFLHGAACHGCLLIAETSCEQYNQFLDRALVVPTVENRNAEFFPLSLQS